MKNKGFTLIELLAVITILSIILLIAFASVGSVIRNSKNSLHDSQINQIEKAAEYYNNKEGLKDYDICINVSDLIDEGYIKQDEVKDPKSGENIEGSVNIKYNGKKYSYEYQEKVCYYTYITLKEDTGTSGLSIGDKYTYEVMDNMEEPYTFYVLSVEGDKVNLIMDRNICNDGTIPTSENPCLYAWHAGENNNNYGPDTAMTNLYNATKDWTNVPNMIMEYVDENNNGTNNGYTGITTENGITTITGKNGATNTTIGTEELPLKARLPRKDEVTSQDAGCHMYNNPSADSGTCSTWLVENLKYQNVSSYAGSGNTDKYNEINSNNGITNIYGYWLLSSVPVNSTYARVVNYGGGVGSLSTSNASFYGLRPVITVPMSTFINK